MSFEYVLLIEQSQKNGLIPFHQNNKKRQNKRQVTKSPPISSHPVDSCFLPHTSIFSKLFFKHTESTLCYHHAHVCKVIHYWVTCQGLHAYGKLTQSSSSLANSSLAMEDFQNLPMLWLCQGWPYTGLVCPLIDAVIACVQSL